MLIATGVLSSAASTGSLTSISSHLAVTFGLPPLMLLVSLTNLPSFSVEQMVTSSDPQAPTAIGSGVTGSPAILSAETLLAGQNANLPSTTNPEPLIELDSMATNTISLSSSTTRPAFALLQLTVAGLPLLATSPATVLTVLATDAYKSVLEAQRKVCLAFLTSDAMSQSKI